MGADVNHNVNPEFNQTPLHTASLNGRTPIVKLLIENENRALDKIGFTPLHLAAQEGHLDIAQLLVKSRARTDVSQWQGFMPIHLTYLVMEAGVSVDVVSTATSN